MMLVRSNFTISGNVYEPGVSLSTSQGSWGRSAPTALLSALLFAVLPSFRGISELPKSIPEQPPNAFDSYLFSILGLPEIGPTHKRVFMKKSDLE